MSSLSEDDLAELSMEDFNFVPIKHAEESKTPVLEREMGTPPGTEKGTADANISIQATAAGRQEPNLSRMHLERMSDHGLIPKHDGASKKDDNESIEDEFVQHAIRESAKDIKHAVDVKISKATSAHEWTYQHERSFDHIDAQQLAHTIKIEEQSIVRAFGTFPIVVEPKFDRFVLVVPLDCPFPEVDEWLAKKNDKAPTTTSEAKLFIASAYKDTEYTCNQLNNVELVSAFFVPRVSLTVHCYKHKTLSDEAELEEAPKHQKAPKRVHHLDEDEHPVKRAKLDNLCHLIKDWVGDVLEKST